MALNDNIKKFREEKNLTQQQLADKLYVSRQTVCRWENGSRCPDLITAKKLALELDVSMDELISDEDVNDANDNSIEYRKRATDPENPVFSGFSLYSENLSDTLKTHENVPVTNR